MPQRFGVWSLLWKSPFSLEAWQDVGPGSFSRMWRYLALLISLAAIIVTIIVQVGMLRVVGNFKQQRWWERNLPDMRIANGQVTSSATQPYVREFDDFVFVLDTTGATGDLDPKYRNGILVKKQEVIIRRQRGAEEIRRFSLSEVPDFELNQASVEELLNRVLSWLWLVVLLGYMVWLWVAKPLQVLFWSLPLLIVNAVSGKRLPYKSLFNLGIYALTVPLIWDLIGMVAAPNQPWWGWVSVGIYVGYWSWGLLQQHTALQQSARQQ